MTEAPTVRVGEGHPRLGLAATGVKRTRTRLTRRGRTLVWMVLAVGLQALALGLARVSGPSVGSVGLLGAAPSAAGRDRGPVPPPTSSAPTTSERVMAAVGGITLRVPGGDVAAVAYHEAALPDALGMRPAGRCVRNANRTKFDIPERTEGPDYLVMSSRGRPHPATSAVDVAMPAGSHVLSPVSGTVIRAKKYFLYGRYLDFRVEIRPENGPKLRVVIIHLDHLAIRKGAEVIAGETPLGVPHLFPFHSQINDYIPARIPHVHLEVKRVGP